MYYIKSPQVVPDYRDLEYVFLAGPILGSKAGWREDLVKKFEANYPEIAKKVVWLDPTREGVIEKLGTKEYEEQVNWESSGLVRSGTILFWIPEKEKDIPGRAYAQTTTVELTEWMTKDPNKVLVGINEDYPLYKYLKKRSSSFNITLESTLDDLLELLYVRLNKRINGGRTFYTSDTHFGSKRTLELSLRPYSDVEEMDSDMISSWNSLVGSGDVIYHLGDFGNYEIAKKLTGSIKLVLGNYEVENMNKLGLSFKEFSEHLKNRFGFSEIHEDHLFNNSSKLYMTHYPIKAAKFNLKHGYYTLWPYT